MEDAKDGSLFALKPLQHQQQTQPSIAKFDDILNNLASLCRAMEAAFTASWSQYMNKQRK
eukprot:2233459-Ditylum_brightwellii.AAC.1